MLSLPLVDREWQLPSAALRPPSPALNIAPSTSRPSATLKTLPSDSRRPSGLPQPLSPYLTGGPAGNTATQQSTQRVIESLTGVPTSSNSSLTKNQKKKQKRKAKKGGGGATSSGAQDCNDGDSEGDDAESAPSGGQATGAGKSDGHAAVGLPVSSETSEGVSGAKADVAAAVAVDIRDAATVASAQHQQQENGHTAVADGPAGSERSVPATGGAAVAAVAEVEPTVVVMVPGCAAKGGLLTVGCKLVDFGNACWVDKHFTDDIQTRQYRWVGCACYNTNDSMNSVLISTTMSRASHLIVQ